MYNSAWKSQQKLGNLRSIGAVCSVLCGATASLQVSTIATINQLFVPFWDWRVSVLDFVSCFVITINCVSLLCVIRHIHTGRDWAHPSHICTVTGPIIATSAPGLGLTPPTSAPGLWLRYYNDENFVRADASSREPDGGSRLDSFLTAVNAAVIAMIIGIYIMTCGAP